MDLLHFWIEGYYSVDFAPNKGLIKKMSDFLTDQVHKTEQVFVNEALALNNSNYGEPWTQ